MLEFSWWRGNSEPGRRLFFFLLNMTVFPDDRLSYLVIDSLKEDEDVQMTSQYSVPSSFLLCYDIILPVGESSFVHLNANQKGIFRELNGGDEVQRRLCFKADLNTCLHEVRVNSNVTHDHQCSSGNKRKSKWGFQTFPTQICYSWIKTKKVSTLC